MQIGGKILVLRLISYVQRARERRRTCVFPQIQPITQTAVTECAILLNDVLCNVLIWILILLTLGNNILLKSFNWPKPVHYVSTDKIDASIRIAIRRILKVKIANFDIRIRRMRILTSFVTSLLLIRTIKNVSKNMHRHPQQISVNCRDGHSKGKSAAIVQAIAGIRASSSLKDWEQRTRNARQEKINIGGTVCAGPARAPHRLP